MLACAAKIVTGVPVECLDAIRAKYAGASLPLLPSDWFSEAELRYDRDSAISVYLFL